MTFGRGSQTLGEEYTDILPFAEGRKRTPSRRVTIGFFRAIRLLDVPQLTKSQRRLLTILFLLLPSILASPSIVAYLRSASTDETVDSSLWARSKRRLAQFLDSPVGQSIPEIHLVTFMLWGRFFEFGKRLTGTTYVRPPVPASASS